MYGTPTLFGAFDLPPGHKAPTHSMLLQLCIAILVLVQDEQRLLISEVFGLSQRSSGQNSITKLFDRIEVL